MTNIFKACSISLGACFLSLWAASIRAADLPKSFSQPMSFEACRQHIDNQMQQLGVLPRDVIVIVSTGVLTMTRICTSDGSILYTCSKLDQKMVVTDSPHQNGCPR